MWKRLDFFDLAENQFTGNIPASLFNVPTIRIVYLSDNKLEGQIPENFGNARRLKDLYLNNNRLSGQIPPISMGQLPALTEFLLQGNELTGIMPASICAIRPSGGILDDLWTDCLGPDPEVECDCCSQCFPSMVA
jgi:Leucine-rich repeat (LRR) protein